MFDLLSHKSSVGHVRSITDYFDLAFKWFGYFTVISSPQIGSSAFVKVTTKLISTDLNLVPTKRRFKLILFHIP